MAGIGDQNVNKHVATPHISRLYHQSEDMRFVVTMEEAHKGDRQKLLCMYM
jgi:hypothetical protein